MSFPRAAQFVTLACCFTASVLAAPDDGSRLTHLDEPWNPYYVSRTFPKLITPQWVGEEGVDAVVVMAIDDMRDPKKYEAYLRPLLERLKRIDGRAPVSIMTNQVDPKDPLLQQWLKEGLSIETHTIDHPCPLLAKGDFAASRSTYDKCVDLMAQVPNSRGPVAFRMPCCDSLNTPSPRFYLEVFDKTTPAGHFLQIDSSVFNITTPNDPELPRRLVLEKDGRERFRKYVPFESFVNTIEDYPYPYVMANVCWQFPCATPSDWQAQNLHKPDNPKTVEDWEALLDATVIKRGVMTMVFHPHNWIKPEQLAELVDYADKRYGKKVKFLNFAEALERLNKNLLDGNSLRDSQGNDAGIRLIDVNGDGYLDVVFGGGAALVWSPAGKTWERVASPDHVAGHYRDIDHDGHAEVIRDDSVWRMTERRSWEKLPFTLPEGRTVDGPKGADTGLRFVDLNQDGFDDVIFSDGQRYGVYLFTSMKEGWSRKAISGRRGEHPAAEEIPMIVRADGTDNGAWFHSNHLWVQNEDTAGMPNLVDRRSYAQLAGNEWPGPKSPEASLACIKVRPGFTVELVAAEPLVMDPVNYDWGPDGKLWVVEMGDYPLGLDGKGKDGGRVRFLEDTDGDGKYDKSTLFIDGLHYPNGVMAWGKGVLISASPEVIYAEDTDGDGRADKREVLYSGFALGNPQHLVNGFVRGLDNWVYGANGHAGGNVKSTKTGQTVPTSGRDFRIRPDDGAIDATAGVSQFSRPRDDWGNWFGCDNSMPIWHFVLDDRYTRRNQHLAFPEPVRNLVEAQENIYPISRTLERFNDFSHVGHITSANGVTIYRDELFGPQFENNWFASEPVHNLVHREVLEPRGVTFDSHRAPGEEKSEFLASTDNWFRPTMLKTGPDGALWVADMYRLVIEHPEWIPMEWQRKLDLRAGADKGRIYRVYPVGAKPRAIPRLDRLDTKQLVAALDSPSGWQRDVAQQLLVRKRDKSAVPPLEELALRGSRPQTRLQALCTLDGLNAVKPDLVVKALSDPHPGVRRHAVRLSESRIEPGVTDALVKLVDDPDAMVRMQLAYTLGEWSDPASGQALGRLALKDASDEYLTAAVFSSVNDKSLVPMMRVVMDPSAGKVPPPAVMDKLLALATATKNKEAVSVLLHAVTEPAGGQFAAWQYAAVAKYLDRGGKADEAAERIDAMTGAARKLAAQSGAPVGQRAAAVGLLGRRGRQDDALLHSLLTPQSPDALQAAAVAALGREGGAESAKGLLAGWKAYGPSLRARVLDVLLARPDGVAAVLDAMESKQVLAADIEAERRQRLLQNAEGPARQRADKLLADVINPDRQKVLETYTSTLSTQGNAARGQAHFTKLCATCHKVGNLGNAVGPDLSALPDKSPEFVLVSVIDPNRAVEAKYTNYVVETKKGLTLSGILASETGNSVTLLGADGKSNVVLRTDLKSMRSTGLSLMPEGLETGLSSQDVSDLIAFVRSSAPAPVRKTFPGNKPEVVRPGPDGSLKLLPSNAEIYGSTIVLEPHYNNLGYWQSEDDHVQWTVEPARPGKYNVWMEWACDDSVQNNRFFLRTGHDETLEHVLGTGTWDHYKRAKVCEIELRLGRQRVTIRPEGKIAGALMDLKSVELVPAR